MPFTCFKYDSHNAPCDTEPWQLIRIRSGRFYYKIRHRLEHKRYLSICDFILLYIQMFLENLWLRRQHCHRSIILLNIHAILWVWPKHRESRGKSCHSDFDKIHLDWNETTCTISNFIIGRAAFLVPSWSLRIQNANRIFRTAVDFEKKNWTILRYIIEMEVLSKKREVEPGESLYLCGHVSR